MGKKKDLIKILAITFTIVIVSTMYMKNKYTKVENVGIGEEFILYNCDVPEHGNEKLYMKVNDIEENESIGYVMTFDLRYEGEKNIHLIDGDESFKYLCYFSIKTSSSKSKQSSKDYYDIENHIAANVWYADYAKHLPDIIKPGDIIKNAKVAIVTPISHEGIQIKDIEFEIKSEELYRHKGKNQKITIKL